MSTGLFDFRALLVLFFLSGALDAAVQGRASGVLLGFEPGLLPSAKSVVPLASAPVLSRIAEERFAGSALTSDARIAPVLASAMQVVTGQNHTCALTASGGVKCWGWNGYGQLGDGTLNSRSTPGDVSGLTSGVVAVAAGYLHTCALTFGGGVKCWGYGGYGQLGEGTWTDRGMPVDVRGLTDGVVALAAGGFYTCALMDAGHGGGVKCWGDNAYGQLGDGTRINRTMPVAVSGLAGGVSTVVAGLSHTCALTSAGGIECWGDNSYGELGDGTTTDRGTPADVLGLIGGVSAVAAGDCYTCALLDADHGGGVKCWGWNRYGQLGNGTQDDRTTPVDVSGLTGGVVAVAAGYLHTCALLDADHGGGMKCWGYNHEAQLGDGTRNAQNAPVTVNGLEGRVAAVAAGGGHTCVLLNAGHGSGVKCWGDNHHGQLGDGTTTARTAPGDVGGLTGVVSAAAAGGEHTCALLNTGDGGGVKCWGANDEGQLGDATATLRYAPGDVSGLTSGVSAVSAGRAHTCAVLDADHGGGVKCWGRNSSGQLGDGTTIERRTPADVSGLARGGVAVAAGGEHACALTTGGGVQCWGYNDYGQLGDGTWEERHTPVDVIGLAEGVSAIVAGEGHTCALMDAVHGGGVKCWGANWDGQLGEGTLTERYTPVTVTGLTGGIAAIAASGSNTCAVMDAAHGSGLKCWGDNHAGQLGDGTLTRRHVPTAVIGLASGVVTVAAGGSHACALMDAAHGGGVKCLGDNHYGQLGDGTMTERHTPVDVIGLAGGVVALVAGEHHTCAVLDAAHGGGVKCWGENDAGQLGVNPGWTPVDVLGLGHRPAVFLPLIFNRADGSR